MGDSRARTGFGQVDLQIDDEAGAAFGELDWEAPSSEPTIPPSATHLANVSTKQTVRRDEGAEVEAEKEAAVDSTRVVASGALAADVMAVARGELDEPPPSSNQTGRSGRHGAPSASRVEAKNDRVAAMREAYARGDAEGALALAEAMESATAPPPAMTTAEALPPTTPPPPLPPTTPPPAMPSTPPPPALSATTPSDYPESTVALEVGEAEIDLPELEVLGIGDGDVPIEAEEPIHERDVTRIAPSIASAPALTQPPPLASLTERQGVPRVLLGPAEISKLPIDHRAGFLLGFIDGMQTMEEILDVCAMPPTEALELIRSLVGMGVIEIE